jgi:sterol desaturase/sphingolipid hydroxylase (fatty acid hydroxylase superfamily)
MDFWSIVLNAYHSYFNYLIGELSSPFHNGGSYFYLLLLISLLVWMLEIIVPWRKNQSVFRKDFFLDAFYMFFNFFIFNLIFFIAFSSVTEKYFHLALNSLHLPKHLLNLDSLSHWIQFLIYFLIADFIQWLIHVFLHHNKFFWKAHQVHHSVTEMGFAAHLRYHWIETFVYKTGLYLILSWVLNFKLEYVFFLHSFTILIGHLNHANINIDYGFLKYVLNNPKMHIWHHSKELPSSHQKGMNFGITLSIWDYFFKTNYTPFNGKDITLGFDKIEKYPKSFLKQLIQPFKKSE